jgi:hypothetical protein
MTQIQKSKEAIRKAAYYVANKSKIDARNTAYRIANADKEKARGAAYRAANKEKTAARVAKYRAATKEKRAAWQSVYDAKNKDKRAAYHAAYYVKNKSRMDAQNAVWEANNKDKLPGYWATYAKKNPGHIRFKCATRRAMHLTQRCVCCTNADIRKVYDVATLCGPGAEVDHIVQLSLGGPHCAKNLRAITVEEHKEKTKSDAALRAFSRRRNRLLRGWPRLTGALH